MATLRDDWCFGPRSSYHPGEKAFYARHEPIVRAWIEEGVASGTIPFVDEAEHAAFCLVSSREMDWRDGPEPRWEGFDLDDFLWSDLCEGGTVGLYEPRRFFHRMVEIVERFGQAGLIDDPSWPGWLARMRTLEEDFVRFYGETPAEEELRRFMAPRVDERIVDRPSAPSLPTRSKPTPAAHRKKRAKRKAQRAARRRGRS